MKKLKTLCAIVGATMVLYATSAVATGQKFKTLDYNLKKVVILMEDACKKDCYMSFLSLGDGRFLSHIDIKDLELRYNHTDTDSEQILSLLGKDVKKSPEKYGFRLEAKLDTGKRLVLHGDSNYGITEYSFSKGYDEKFLKFEDSDKKFKERANELLTMTKKVFNVEEFMKYEDGVSFTYTKGKFHNSSDGEAKRKKYDQKLKELANETLKIPESDFETIKNILSTILSYAQTKGDIKN